MRNEERFRVSDVGARAAFILTCALGFIGSMIGADAQAVRSAARFHVVTPALASRGNEPWRYAAISTFPAIQGQYYNPVSALIADARGNLYGTSHYGGSNAGCDSGCGYFFELTPPAPGQYVWTRRDLYDFTPATGAWPSLDALVADPHGNLYGTTYIGGDLSCGDPSGCGTIFELTPPGPGRLVWTQRVLHTFSETTRGSPGSFNPQSGLTMDARGALYGTTESGGDPLCHCGVVYQLAAPAPGSFGWNENVLHAFTGSDGEFPSAGVVIDTHDNLYGTAGGGAQSCVCGVVFELSPSARNASWTEHVLHIFNARYDGSNPEQLVMDASGVLYGTTGAGGASVCDGSFPPGCGTVFKLTPPQPGASDWIESVIYNVPSTGGYGDGTHPASGLTIGAHGELYGETYASYDLCASATFATANCGAVYELSPPPFGQPPWIAHVLHTFTNPDVGPSALLRDPRSGALFGTTGIHVFELAPPASCQPARMPWCQ